MCGATACTLHLALCSLQIGAMGARCRTKHAQLLTESEISLTWALACGVDPASCELQAASCKVTKKSSLAPVGSILRAASCKLRACEQQKSRASDLCRMTTGSSYSISVVVCPRSSAPEPRSEGRPSKSRRRAAMLRVAGARGDTEWVCTGPAAAHTRPTIDQYT